MTTTATAKKVKQLFAVLIYNLMEKLHTKDLKEFYHTTSNFRLQGNVSEMLRPWLFKRRDDKLLSLMS